MVTANVGASSVVVVTSSRLAQALSSQPGRACLRSKEPRDTAEPSRTARGSGGSRWTIPSIDLAIAPCGPLPPPAGIEPPTPPSYSPKPRSSMPGHYADACDQLRDGSPQLVAPSVRTHHMVRRRAGISCRARRTSTPPSASAIPAQNWAQRTEEPVRARVPVPPVPETVSPRAAIVVVVPPPP